MGAKLEEKVLRSIAQYRQRTGRYLLSYAERRGGGTDGRALRQVPGVDAVTPAGSLRRGRETVGDLDLLVTGPDAAAALDRFVGYPRVEEVLASGENKASAKVGREGLQVDVRALPPESFGAAMQYFTGSKDHNVAIRTRAVKMGLKLSEYGLFRVEDDVAGGGRDRRGHLRGARAAVDSAGTARERGRDRSRRRGPPAGAGGTAATSAATSTCTPRRPMAAPRSKKWRRRRGERGYEYIAITDHSKALAMANGLDEKRVVEFAQPGARDQPRRTWASAIFSRHRVRHPAGRRAWTWPTTRWPSSTW